jgi:hypothetical protein
MPSPYGLFRAQDVTASTGFAHSFIRHKDIRHKDESVMDTRSEHSEGYGVEDRLPQPRWHRWLALLLTGSYVASSLYISEHRHL